VQNPRGGAAATPEQQQQHHSRRRGGETYVESCGGVRRWDTLAGAGVGGGVDAAGETEVVGVGANKGGELPWEMNPKPLHLRLPP
jgi:hypothetical protein